MFDYRPALPSFGFPERLDGRRALDVGAADGFFSFELERRGATVVALDSNAFDGTPAIDPSVAHGDAYRRKYREQFGSLAAFPDVFESAGVPVGHRFLLARRLLDSEVTYRHGSVYDLDGGQETFDLIFCGALIEHLKNPVEAVERIRAALRPDGLCIVTVSNVLQARITHPLLLRALRRLGLPVVAVERGVTYNGNVSGGSFFHFYAETFRELLLASGFRDVRIQARFAIEHQRPGRGPANHHATFHCRR